MNMCGRRVCGALLDWEKVRKGECSVWETRSWRKLQIRRIEDTSLDEGVLENTLEILREGTQERRWRVREPRMEGEQPNQGATPMGGVPPDRQAILRRRAYWQEAAKESTLVLFPVDKWRHEKTTINHRQPLRVTGRSFSWIYGEITIVWLH